MKRMKELLKRLSAVGLAAVLLAGTVPETLYAEELQDYDTVDLQDEDISGDNGAVLTDEGIFAVSDAEAGEQAFSAEDGTEDMMPVSGDIDEESDAAEDGNGAYDEDINGEPGEDEEVTDAETTLSDEAEAGSLQPFNIEMLGSPDDTIKTITGLGIGAIGDPVAPQNYSDPWKGSYVYFGHYTLEGDHPARYRVLDAETTAYSETGTNRKTMFLDSDQTLFKSKMNDTIGDVSWADSDLRENLNAFSYLYVSDDSYMKNKFNMILGKMELSAVSLSTIASEPLGSLAVPSAPDGTPYYTASTALDEDRFFVLDYKEAMTPAYGYLNQTGKLNDSAAGTVASRRKEKAYTQDAQLPYDNYWLRSEIYFPNYNPQYVYGLVWDKGTLDRDTNMNEKIGVSPALNIDLSRVLFSSLCKSSGAAAGQIGAEYKLTLLNDGVRIIPGETARDGDEITTSFYLFVDENVPYERQPSYVSVVVTDGTWTEDGWSDGAQLLQYTLLDTDVIDGTSGSGRVTFTLDNSISGTWGEDYHVYLLAETVEEDYDRYSDYASTPVEIPLHSHDISVTQKDNVLTLTCSEEGCSLPDQKVSCWLKAPDKGSLCYGADKDKYIVTIESDDKMAFASALLSVGGDYPSVMYAGRGTTEYEFSDIPPEVPGLYTASLTIGEETISADYEIGKALLYVSADNITISYGEDADWPALWDLHFDGFVKDESYSDLDGELTFTTSYSNGMDSGTYTFKPAGLISDNYDIVFEDKKLIVEKADPDYSQPQSMDELMTSVYRDGLTYNGYAQELVKPGETQDGVFWYAVTDNGVSDAPDFDAGRNKIWSKALPKAVDAGTYKVWWLIKGDKNHKDSDVGFVSATINPYVDYDEEVDKEIDIYRYYPVTGGAWDSIKIIDYLPPDAGDCRWYADRDVTITAKDENGQDASDWFQELGPDAFHELSYDLSNDRGAGHTVTITVGPVRTQNYEHEYEEPFTVRVHISFTDYAMSEWDGTKYTRIKKSKKLITGKSVELCLTDRDDAVADDVDIMWISDNPGIATVTQSGKVTARSVGKTTITAKLVSTGQTAGQCKVNVLEPVAEILLDKTKHDFGVGEMTELSREVLPNEASDSVIWSTSDANTLILVDNEGIELEGTTGADGKSKTYIQRSLYTVRVKALAQTKGTKRVKITAAATDGSGVKASCAFKVGKSATEFTITPKSGNKTVYEVMPGKSLKMTVNWSGGTPADPGIIWAVYNAEKYLEDGTLIRDDAASISASGVLTGYQPGRVVVAAVSEANPEECNAVSEPITVYVPVRSVALNRTSATVSTAEDAPDDEDALHLWVDLVAADSSKGSSQYSSAKNLTGFGDPSDPEEDSYVEIVGCNATGPELTQYGSHPQVRFAVPDDYASLIEVTPDGYVHAKPAAEGTVYPATAYVEAYVSAYNYSNEESPLRCKVTVRESNPFKSVSIPKKLTIGVDNYTYIEALLNPANPDTNSFSSITWSVNDKGKRIIDIYDMKPENGVYAAQIIGLKPGNAKVTVTAWGPVVSGKAAVLSKATCKVTVKPSVKTIRFKNASSFTKGGLPVGKTLKLKTAFTLTGKGKAASTALKWTSSNTKIAEVSAKGVVTAKKPGESVTITATSTDNKTGFISAPSVSVTFSVYQPVKSIRTERKSLKLGTQGLARYGHLNILSYAPDNATDPSVKWTVDKKSKGVKLGVITAGRTERNAEYTEQAGQSVTVGDGESLAIMALTPGVVKLTGVTTDGSKKKLKCTVTVRGELTGLKLKTAKAKKGVNNVTLADDETTKDVIEYTGTVKAGTSMTLKPQVEINGITSSKKAYKTYKKYTDTGVFYMSSDTSIATVNGKGRITVLPIAGNGAEVVIYVITADGRYKAAYKITVKGISSST